MCNSLWFRPSVNSCSGCLISWLLRNESHDQTCTSARVETAARNRFCAITLLVAASCDCIFAGLTQTSMCISPCITSKRERKYSAQELVSTLSLYFQSFPMLLCGKLPNVDRLRSQHVSFTNLRSQIESAQDNFSRSEFMKQFDEWDPEERDHFMKRECKSGNVHRAIYTAWIDLADRLMDDGDHIHDNNENLSSCETLRAAIDLIRLQLDTYYFDFDWRTINIPLFKKTNPVLINLVKRIVANLGVIKIQNASKKDNTPTLTSHIDSTSIGVSESEKKSLLELDISIERRLSNQISTASNALQLNMDEFAKELFPIPEEFQSVEYPPRRFYGEQTDQYNEQKRHFIFRNLLVDHFNTKTTLLEFAVVNGFPNEVGILLNNGMDRDQVNSEGMILIESLIFKGLNCTKKMIDIAKMLLIRNATFYSVDFMDPILFKGVENRIRISFGEMVNKLDAELENSTNRYLKYVMTPSLSVITKQQLQDWQKAYRRSMQSEHLKAAERCLKVIEKTKIFPEVISRIVAEYAHEGF